MLNRILSVFKRSQNASAKSGEQNYSVSPDQADTVAAAFGLISFQIMMSKEQFQDEEPPVRSIEDPGLISYWIVGYVTGLLDAATQYRHNRAQFTGEMLNFMYEVVFTKRHQMAAYGCYASAVAVKDFPQDPFYPVFKEFDAGMKEGFGLFFNVLENKPNMRFLQALMNNGLPDNLA